MLQLGLGTPVIIMVCPGLKDMFCTTTPWKRKKKKRKRTQTTRFQPLPLLELLEIIHPLSFVLHLVLSVQSHSTEPNWTELQTICFHSRDIYELGAAPTRAASRTVGWWDNYPSADLLKSSWNDEDYQNKQAGSQIFPNRRTCGEPRVGFYPVHVAPSVSWKVLQCGKWAAVSEIAVLAELSARLYFKVSFTNIIHYIILLSVHVITLLKFILTNLFNPYKTK